MGGEKKSVFESGHLQVRKKQWRPEFKAIDYPYVGG